MASQVITVEDGIATLPDGRTVDLVLIQVILCHAFAGLGHQGYATAADEMALLSLKYIGPHEEVLDLTDEMRRELSCSPKT
jgi:hypothetical protein